MSTEMESMITEARDPDTSWKRLLKLAKHPEVEVRRALLDNPNLCPTNDQGKLKTSLLEKLAKEFPEEVANLPVFVLHALIEPNEEMKWVLKEVMKRTADVVLIEHVFRTWGTSSWVIRCSIALNPNTPVNLLRIMGTRETEQDEDVRQAVSYNKNTPGDLLRRLCEESTEGEYKIRLGVARNPNAPEDVLRRLGYIRTEFSECIRICVMENPNTPEDLLRSNILPLFEPNSDVRKAAAKAIQNRSAT